MTVDVNEEGVITTNPEIIEENVKNKISSLLLTKESISKSSADCL